MSSNVRQTSQVLDFQLCADNIQDGSSPLTYQTGLHGVVVSTTSATRSLDVSVCVLWFAGDVSSVHDYSQSNQSTTSLSQVQRGEQLLDLIGCWKCSLRHALVSLQCLCRHHQIQNMLLKTMTFLSFSIWSVVLAIFCWIQGSKIQIMSPIFEIERLKYVWTDTGWVLFSILLFFEPLKTTFFSIFSRIKILRPSQ